MNKLLLTPAQAHSAGNINRWDEEVWGDFQSRREMEIAKAQLAKCQEAKLDRPNREKIERILDELLFSPAESKDGQTYNLTACIDKLQALIPDKTIRIRPRFTKHTDIEEAKREERERIDTILRKPLMYFTTDRLHPSGTNTTSHFVDSEAVDALWQALKSKEKVNE